jgi:hypothetical protein
VNDQDAANSGDTKLFVGFMADSGMFAMVRRHGISAFPNTILIKTEFSSGGESS